MRYAPAGYKFAIPLSDILNAKGGYLQAKDGSKEADWEPQVRIGRKGSDSDGLFHPVSHVFLEPLCVAHSVLL